MLELLAPWAGQRQRVMRLIELTGIGAPRFGPRFALHRHPRASDALGASVGGERRRRTAPATPRAAQSPKSRSASATSAEPGLRVDPEHRAALAEVAVRGGRVAPSPSSAATSCARISKPSPQSFGSCAPKPGSTPRRPGYCTVVASAQRRRGQQAGRREQLVHHAGEVGDGRDAVARRRAGQRRVASAAAGATHAPRRGTAANGMPVAGSTSAAGQLDADVGVDPPGAPARNDAHRPLRARARTRARAGAAASRRAPAPRRPGRRGRPPPPRPRPASPARPAAWSPRRARNALLDRAVRREHAGRPDDGRGRGRRPASSSTASSGVERAHQAEPGARPARPGAAGRAATPSGSASHGNHRRSSDSSLRTGSAPCGRDGEVAARRSAGSGRRASR